MERNPLAEALERWNEQVGKPWANLIETRFQELGAAFVASRAATRAKPCPCGCGNTLGEVMGDGIVNPHALGLR